MTTAGLSNIEDNADLHLTDRLALVAHDLRVASLWLEERRDELEDVGLDNAYFDGPSTRMRLTFVCTRVDQFRAAALVLVDGVGDIDEDRSDRYVYATRRIGSVVIEAFIERKRLIPLALKTAVA